METVSLFTAAARRGWWIVLVTGVAAAAAAATVATRQSPVYQASITLLISPGSKIEKPRNILRGFETLERRTIVSTIAKIASRKSTRIKAAKRIELDLSKARAYWIGASILPNTNMIRVDVQGPDPALAARLADGVAAVTRRTTRSHYRVFNVRPLAPAVASRRPIRPNVYRSTWSALLLGLFLGAVVALAVEARRSRPQS